VVIYFVFAVTLGKFSADSKYVTVILFKDFP